MSAVRHHVQRVHHAIAAGEAARSALVASWERSLLRHGLDPGATLPVRVSGAEAVAREADLCGALLDHAEPACGRLWSALQGQPACLALAGAAGLLLRLFLAESDRDALRATGLREGADWSEASAGTNGIGTSLADGQARIIHLDQHFLARDVGISCVAVPLHDPRGRLAGALNLTFYGLPAQRSLPGLYLAPMLEAARQIETRHFHEVHARDRILLLPVPGREAGALIAADRDGVVTGANRAARMACGLDDARIARGVLADSLLLPAPEEAGTALQDAERAALRRALIRRQGNASAAARDLGISRATIKRKIKDHHLSPRAPATG